MDGEIIDAILKPFLDQLPGVSDERDIDESDADEEIVFKAPIVGGSDPCSASGSCAPI